MYDSIIIWQRQKKAIVYPKNNTLLKSIVSWKEKKK